MHYLAMGQRTLSCLFSRPSGISAQRCATTRLPFSIKDAPDRTEKERPACCDRTSFIRYGHGCSGKTPIQIDASKDRLTDTPPNLNSKSKFYIHTSLFKIGNKFCKRDQESIKLIDIDLDA